MDTFEDYRPLLFSLAYRMTGMAGEAEDIVQDAYLRYQGAGDVDVRSLKAYLTTVVTRLSLDYLKSARARREQYYGEWLPEPVLTASNAAPLPLETLEQRETISLAFLALLEYLTPQERAVFLLRDIFDFDYADIAAMLSLSAAYCRQLLHRARERLAEKRQRFEPSPEAQLRLTERFLSAMEHGDLAGLTELLVEDVAVHGDGGGKVPAIARTMVGRERVLKFFLGTMRKAPEGARVSIAEVNAGPALLIWLRDDLYAVFTLAFDGDRIASLHNVLNPDKLAYLTRQIAAS